MLVPIIPEELLDYFVKAIDAYNFGLTVEAYLALQEWSDNAKQILRIEKANKEYETMLSAAQIDWVECQEKLRQWERATTIS